MIQHAAEASPPWCPWPTDHAAAGRVARELGLDPLVGVLLEHRGLGAPEAAKAFLEPSVDDLQDPLGLHDMPLAAERVARAVVDHEPILIYGDADVDGLTSTGLLVQYLRSLSIEPLIFVPNRAYDGYSFTEAGVEHVLKSGARVVISVDNGMSSVAPVAQLAAAGVDVIITDHHMPGEQLPPALAVVNPRHPDCRYGFKGLAGVGVAFKLACAVSGMLHRRQQVAPSMGRVLGESLAWVAMGTVADLMPLRGENRVLVSRGLRALPRSTAPGLAALCAVAGLGPGSDCRAEDVAFRLAPRLNAATRMGRSDLSVELVCARDPQQASRLAAQLDEANRQRQAAERELMEELEPLLQDCPPDEPVVLASERWNTGLLGLVAGRLARHRGQPAVLVSSLQGDPAKGSCRSVPGFDVHAALQSCSSLLHTHGGHAAAAGFSIETRQFPAFREAFLAAWRAQREGAGGPAPLQYEAEVPLAALTLPLLGLIEALEPFGKENPRPVLVTGGVRVREVRRMGSDGQHLALSVAQGEVVLRAVAFGQGGWIDCLAEGQSVDVIYTPRLNRFRGRTTVELELVSVRPARAG